MLDQIFGRLFSSQWIVFAVLLLLLVGLSELAWRMQWQAAIVRGVDGRSRGAVINKCQPTCVAVSKHIDGLVALRFRDLPNQLQAVLPDHGDGPALR